MDRGGTDPTVDGGSVEGYDTNWHLMSVVHEGKYDNMILLHGHMILVSFVRMVRLDLIMTGLCPSVWSLVPVMTIQKTLRDKLQNL